MPELPEVEITCRKLAPLLIGERFLGFWSDWPRGLKDFSKGICRDIQSRKIVSVKRRGKAILIYLSGGRILAFHQKMSGKVLVVQRNIADKHIHFRFLLSSGEDLVLHDARKFGMVWYGTEGKVIAEKYFRNLGEDASNVSFADFVSALRGKKGMLKPIFLRQNIFSGIGNIITDETLWKAGLHPQRSAGSLNGREMKALWESLQYILAKSIRLGGSTMRDWLQPDSTAGGYFQKRFVYGRKGSACPRCKGIITRLVVASRGTFICEHCQHKTQS